MSSLEQSIAQLCAHVAAVSAHHEQEKQRLSHLRDTFGRRKVVQRNAWDDMLRHTTFMESAFRAHKK